MRKVKMKIRHKRTGDIMDVERVLFVNKDENLPNYVVKCLSSSDATIKTINEEFEDVELIELPEEIRKALQTWIDAQNIGIRDIHYYEHDGLDCSDFDITTEDCLTLRIQFRGRCGLKNFKKYYPEELGLETNRHQKNIKKGEDR